ncbi:MAG: hypothetical protein PVF05_13570 [Gemmatimonadales bacterium]|jgi:hypothetical protein
MPYVRETVAESPQARGSDEMRKVLLVVGLEVARRILVKVLRV